MYCMASTITLVKNYFYTIIVAFFSAMPRNFQNAILTIDTAPKTL